MHRSTRVVVVVSVLLAAVLSVATNVASSATPSSWRPYLWLAWPIAAVLVLVYAVVEVSRARSDDYERPSPGSVSVRSRLLDRVDRIWVSGGLEHSLYHEARLELGLAKSVEAQHPWGLTLAEPRGQPQPVPVGTPIHVVFEELDKTMLILGAPGSGKTTTMLELLRDLLTQARHDSSAPIPAFLPLSSWILRREPLEVWISREVSERYQIPISHVRAWLDNEHLSLMLDGLDEVAVEYREQCIGAINGFRQKHGTVPIVVSCRTEDYQDFRTKLKLYGTLTILPLSREQVKLFLDRLDRSFGQVQLMLTREESLWELVDNPLMLSVMILAFRDRASEETFVSVAGQGLSERLFTTYVRTMLGRRLTADQSPRSTVLRVAFLARQLEQTKQTVFSFDLLDDRFLPTKTLMFADYETRVWPAFNALAIGAIVGALYGWRGVIVGVIGGCIAGLGPIERIQTGDISDQRTDPRLSTRAYYNWKLTWRAADIRDAISFEFRSEYKKENINIGSLLLVISVLAGVLLGSLHSVRSVVLHVTATFLIGVIAVLTVKVFWYTSEPAPHNLRIEFPSSGLRAVLRNGVFVTLGVAAISGVLAAGLVDLRFGLASAASVALYLLGCFGGYALIQQAQVRFLLRKSDFLPFPSGRFFDYGVQCLFLRRVGDGYIFVHRSLQEFFSNLWIPDTDKLDLDRMHALIPRN